MLPGPFRYQTPGRRVQDTAATAAGSVGVGVALQQQPLHVGLFQDCGSLEGGAVLATLRIYAGHLAEDQRQRLNVSAAHRSLGRAGAATAGNRHRGAAIEHLVH